MTAESAVVKVRVLLGSDGNAYYVAMYGNNEKGPRSEGYRGDTPKAAVRAAIEAAVRDFPEAVLEVDGSVRATGG